MTTPQQDYDRGQAAVKREKYWNGLAPDARLSVIKHYWPQPESLIASCAKRRWHELSHDVYSKLAGDNSWWKGGLGSGAQQEQKPVREAPKMKVL